MAAKDTRRVTVVFGSETSGAEQGFKKVGKSSEELSAKTGKLGEIFDKLGPGILASLGAESVAEVFHRVIGGASDLNETISKTKNVFKVNGDEIVSWAGTTASSMGISKRAALENVSAFGNMFEQIGLTEKSAQTMSQRWVQLASDFASFHNAEPADVMEALSAATRGEYDALQRYVPTVSAATVQTEALAETHKRTAGALTVTEKATALYNLTLKDAGAATGDFQRTANGAANQQRILTATLEDSAAKIGQVVLPAYQGVLGLVNHIGPLNLAVLGLAIAFGNKLTAGITVARTAVATYLTGLRTAAIATAAASGATTRFGAALGTMRAAASTAALSIQKVWASTSTITKVGIALTALQVASAGLGSSAAPNVDRLTTSLVKLQDTGKVSGEAARTLGNDFGKFDEGLKFVGNGWLKSLGRTLEGATEGMTGLGSVLDDSLQHMNERMSGLDNALAQLAQNGNADKAKAIFDQLAERAKKQGVTTAELKDKLKEYSAQLELMTAQQADAARVAGSDFTPVMDKLATAISGTATSIQPFTDALAGVGKTGENLGTQLLEVGSIVEGVGNTQLNAADKSKVFSDGLTAIADSAAPFADKAKTLAGVFDSIGDAQLTAKAKGDLLKQTLDALHGAAISQTEAEETAATSVDSLSETLKKNGQQFDLNTSKTAKQRTATLANRDALEAALTATRDKYIADVAAGDKANVARGKYEKQTKAILDQIDPTKRNSDAVKTLVERYGSVPKAKNTHIGIDGDKTALIALLKSFALQKALSAGNWTKSQTDSYFNGLYGTYITGNKNDSGNLNPHVNPGQTLAHGGSVGGYSPHSKADNIAAWLTAREYVHPVDAVDYYGVSTMDAIRTKRIPAALLKSIAGFASGGLVAGGGTWPFTVKEIVKNPVDLGALQKQFAAMLAGGGVGGSNGKPFGTGWQNQLATLRAAGFDFHPSPQQTYTGGHAPNSWHYKGRAVDLSPPNSEVWNWLVANYARTSQELFWASKPVNYRHGQAIGPMDKTNHIHWAYDEGGMLPPGTTVAHNNTGRPEYVLTEDQMRGPQVNVYVTVQGNVTAEQDLARSIATEVRNELVRKASRNGGKTGL